VGGESQRKGEIRGYPKVMGLDCVDRIGNGKRGEKKKKIKVWGIINLCLREEWGILLERQERVIKHNYSHFSRKEKRNKKRK